MSIIRDHSNWFKLISIVLCTLPINGLSQHLDVDGKIRISQLEKDNTADSVVVPLPDGTLGIRDISSLTEYQILSRNGDSIFLTNGGFVVLPDPDSTNEIQEFSVSSAGDTLYLSKSNWVIIPGLSDTNPEPIDASNAAAAMEMTGLENATWVLPDGSSPPDTSTFHLGYGILPTFGPNISPQAGQDFVAISTGAARIPTDMDFQELLEKGYSNNLPSGFPKAFIGCSGACPTPSANGFDGLALQLTFTTPNNVNGFSFDYKFYTQDYPDYTCSMYSDEVAVYTIPTLPGAPSDNILFDANANPVSVNSVEVCAPFDCFVCPYGSLELNGTGFEGNGATAWMTGTYPILPSTKYTIYFSIWDSGDGSGRSTLLLDNWQWISN